MIKSIKHITPKPLVLLTMVMLLLCGIASAQYDIPPRPKSDLSLIFDYTDNAVLTPNEKQALNQKLIAYERETSTQIGIIIVKSLKGEDPNFLAAQWAHKWGFGQKDKDNGLVILMSSEDRKIAIQNGYGLEEFMTDARSRQIIANVIIPYFKQENYYKGLDEGVDAIFRVLDGTFVEDGSQNQEGTEIFGFLFIVVVMFLVIYLISRNNRGGGGGNGGRRSSMGDVIFTDFGRSTWSGRSGGFGGGSFGGGGFGGFGGGGFGGGGASGSW